MATAVPAAPRTSLFLPALATERARRAAQAGADEIVLDLEDSIATARKAEARERLADTARELRAHGFAGTVTVRVNHRADSGPDADALPADVRACVEAGLRSLLVPKVERADDVHAVREALVAAGGDAELGVLIESSRAVLDVGDVLRDSGTLRSVALGNEDLRAELELGAPGRHSEPPGLVWAHGALVLAAHAHGIPALGIAGSLAELDDLDLLGTWGVAARRMGYAGTYCVHPRQVPVLNRAYSPDAVDLDWARRVVATADDPDTDPRGAFRLDGRMVDAPLVERARRIIATACVDPIDPI
ncbi:HpcH/HpaI aldolase/citrate lyase family protein [Jatrophihabitans fulvus]